jgi:hypothetical protein
MSKRKIVLLSVVVVLMALVIGCAIYVSDYYRADETAASAMNGTENVSVYAEDNCVVFQPKEPVAGFIFYPGGKVEHTAYAPLMLELAKHDILCIIVEMPFHLAVLNMNGAKKIPDRFPQIESWYIGGHSLGGSMAASHAAKHTDTYDGLVLLAAYSTAQITDLSVLSIYGTADGVMDAEKYEKYLGNLPKETVEVVLDGANHAGFGSYGAQDGDGEATISQQEQVERTVQAIVSMIKQ